MGKDDFPAIPVVHLAHLHCPVSASLGQMHYLNYEHRGSLTWSLKNYSGALGSTNPMKVYVDLCYMYIFLGQGIQENHAFVKPLEG